MFMVTLDTTITNIALPDITNYFKETLTNTNWISTIYVLVMAILTIPAAKFGDQFGRKRIMLIGLIIFGSGSILCGFSKTLLMLISMRFIQGIGGAIVTPIMIPLSVSLFGRKRANQAVGIIGAVTAVAAAAGPPIGGMLLKFLSWQWIFFVNVPIVVVTVLLLSICFTESVDDSLTKQIDVMGILFLTLTLAPLTLLLVKGYDFGWKSATSLTLGGVSLISLVVFIIVESRVTAPLMELKLFGERTFTASTIIYFMCGFTIVCSSLVFNFFLENVRGYSALNASMIIMFMSITVMVSMPVGSWLAELFGYQWIITSGMILMTLILVLLSRLKPETTKLMMIMFMVILGSGFGFACLAIVAAVQKIPDNKAGIASGIVNAARQLGTCLGIALLVGTMTHSINHAKHQIKQDARIEINHAKLPHSVSSAITVQLNTAGSNLQSNAFRHRLKTAVLSVPNSVNPQNSQLKEIYDGLSDLQKQFSGRPGTLSTLSAQVNEGQKLFNAQKDAIITKLLINAEDANTSEPVATNVKMLNSEGSQLALGQAELASSLAKTGRVNHALIKMKHGIVALDLNAQLTKLFKKIAKTKDQLLTDAFNHVFLLAGMIIGLSSIIGPFTSVRKSHAKGRSQSVI